MLSDMLEYGITNTLLIGYWDRNLSNDQFEMIALGQISPDANYRAIFVIRDSGSEFLFSKRTILLSHFGAWRKLYQYESLC